MKSNARPRRARWVLLAVAVVVVAGLVGLWRSLDRTELEVLSPMRGEIRESFSEPARTRLSKTYPITMPIRGRLERIELEPGDPVKVGQELAPFDRVPFEQAVKEAKAAVQELEAQLAVKNDNRLENTAVEQSRAAVDAAREAVKAAQAQVNAEQARADRASKELKRMEALVASKAISESVFDDVRLAAETSLIALREKEFNQATTNAMLVVIELMPRLIEQYIARKTLEADVLTRQIDQARARLVLAEHELTLAQLRSPIDGVVLERFEQGGGFLNPGQQLLLLGNMDHLEVIVDVLTEDALKLSTSSRVSLEPAAGLSALSGTVKRVEPKGFTKLSSLGVEQQRVNVIVGFDQPPRDLGVDYRLQAHFFIASKSDALILPRYAVMQSPQGENYVLVVRDGRLARQPVRVGLASDLNLEITEGLTDQDVVVAHPEATMKAGTRVNPLVLSWTP